MTPSQFKAIYPEFSTIGDTVVQAQLSAFDAEYAGDYGELADKLTGLYAAHMLTVFSVNTASGPLQVVSARKVDSLSWSYSEGAEAPAGEFASTKYGVEFSRLMRLFGKGPVMSGAYRGIVR